MLLKKITPVAPARGDDPFTTLRQMTSELERFFETPWPTRGWQGMPKLFRATNGDAVWLPEIDVFEKDGALVTRADLPGLKRDDVKVEAAEGYLRISGQRNAEVEEKKDHYLRCEREYGHFVRTVPLPEGTVPDAITATFTDGVLEVRVPLPAAASAAAPKTVPIEAKA